MGKEALPGIKNAKKNLPKREPWEAIKFKQNVMRNYCLRYNTRR
jgi:hypothetical protein